MSQYWENINKPTKSIYFIGHTHPKHKPGKPIPILEHFKLPSRLFELWQTDFLQLPQLKDINRFWQQLYVFSLN